MGVDSPPAPLPRRFSPFSSFLWIYFFSLCFFSVCLGFLRFDPQPFCLELLIRRTSDFFPFFIPFAIQSVSSPCDVPSLFLLRDQILSLVLPSSRPFSCVSAGGSPHQLANTPPFSSARFFPALGSFVPLATQPCVRRTSIPFLHSNVRALHSLIVLCTSADAPPSPRAFFYPSFLRLRWNRLNFDRPFLRYVKELA